MLSRRIAASAAALAALAVLGACGGGGDDAPPTPLPFTVVSSSTFSAVKDPRTVTVHDNAAWASLWAEHTAGITPPPPLPPVDFSGQSVAAVFLGTSAPCSQPVVDSVAVDASGIVVTWGIVGPAPGSPCVALVAGTPAVMVRFANPSHVNVSFRRL